MIKAIIFMGLGALIFYLYQNPGEMTSVIDQGKALINQGASICLLYTSDAADE